VILAEPDDATRVETMAIELVTVSGERSGFSADLSQEGLTEIAIGTDELISTLQLSIESVSDPQGAARISEVQLVTPSGRLNTTPVVEVPTEIRRIEPSEVGAVSYSFRQLGRFEEYRMVRQFETIRPQVFDVRGSMFSFGGVLADADGCARILRIDDAVYSVRPAEGSTWFDFELEVEGCEQVQLDQGSHQLAELSNNGTALASLTLVDADLSEQAVPVEQIEQRRLGSGLFEYDVPEGAGYLSTSVPFDRRWEATIQGREATVLDGFGRSLWVVSDGSPEVFTVEFSLRVAYLVALVVSSATVVISLWLAVVRRRR
jgi:hypothetical protein